MDEPLVSVLLCVYNGERYLAQALDSVRNQTLRDFECIVVDDGSTDSTPEILDRYARKDSRIRVVRNEKNLRLPASLNRALAQAAGHYLIRMDGDDRCRPDRFARQVEFMRANPQVDAACCGYIGWDGTALYPGLDSRRHDPESVRALFLFFNPMVHPGMIFRRETLKGMGYDPACTCTEDLDLWVRLLCAGRRLAVQEEYLLLYRRHPGQITVNSDQAQREQCRDILCRFYGHALFRPTEEEADFLVRGIYFRDEPDAEKLNRLLRRIWEENRKKNGFAPESVRYAALEMLLEYRRAGVPLGKLAPMALRLGPGFLVGELLRRRRAGREDRRRREAAEKIFASPEGQHKFEGEKVTDEN